MEAKLDCVMLVDDDEGINFLNELILTESGIVRNIIKATSALEALEYLKQLIRLNKPLPDLIFLDINMPGMNGWDFLEKYKSLDEEVKKRSNVVMLTTSHNPDDRRRAGKFREIAAFLHKPLTEEILQGLVKTLPS